MAIPYRGRQPRVKRPVGRALRLPTFQCSAERAWRGWKRRVSPGRRYYLVQDELAGLTEEARKPCRHWCRIHTNSFCSARRRLSGNREYQSDYQVLPCGTRDAGA